MVFFFSLRYIIYIMPVVDYCCIMFGSDKKVHISKITSLQKRTEKYILFVPKSSHSVELFLTLSGRHPKAVVVTCIIQG